MQRIPGRFGFPVHDLGPLSSSVLQDAPEGVLSFDYGEGKLDLLNLPRGHDVTVVMFHAALSKRTRALPIFSGIPISEGLDCNLICVSDPSIARSPLELGWHVGNDDQPFQVDLPGMVQSLSESHSARKLIFLGASGGGFAALRYSRLFPGSLAIVMNPQTSIARYTRTFVDQFLQICFAVESVEDLPSWVEHDLVSAYSSPFENTVAYLQNVGDGHHVSKHLMPFLDNAPGNGSLLVKTVDLGKGHVGICQGG